ncbi:MAG: DsbA family protein [Pyrinomonadaceae bacterium]
MKILFPFILLILFSFTLFAQTDEILAAANGKNYTVLDLPPNVADAYGKLPSIISGLRTELLARRISDILFETEAAARKTTVDALIEAEMKRRVAEPTAEQIQAVYNANRDSIGSRALAEVRPQIVSFLRREPEQKALADFAAELTAKYKVVSGKDVNANLLSSDVLATVGGKLLTAQSFEMTAKKELYETRMQIYEAAEDALNQQIYSALISAEAKSLGIQPEDLIAREVSDKMKNFSGEEREQLESALQKRLFQKYNANILLKEPAPFVQNISIPAGTPSRGSISAPVTVVMFTDFQCPACSGAHPVLQKVLAEYPGKIRFIVRNFPLTTLHANAFRAAQAAAAANAQGKFFEYTDVLYTHQDALDGASLKRYAGELGLNQKQFDSDLDGGKYADPVKKDLAEGASYGIAGTPTIFVNGVAVRQLTATAFRNAINRALEK